MWLPALLVTTFLRCTFAETNVTADVEAFITKFRELNETVDVLESLENIGEHSSELFQLGRPVGNLLRTFNDSGNTTIEEENVFWELNKLFKDSQHLDTDTTVDMVLESRYDNHNRLTTVLSYLDHHTNVTSHRQSNWNFRDAMGSIFLYVPDYVPMKTLESIDDSTRVKCRMPSKEGLKRVVLVQEAFRRLENRIREAWNESEYRTVDFYKNRILSIVHSRATEEDTNELIAEIDKLEVNSTTPDTVHAVLTKCHFNMTGDFSFVEPWGTGLKIAGEKSYIASQKSCVLESALDHHAFNQTVMYAKLKHLHRDLLKVQLLVWAITSLRESDDEYYEKDTEMAVLALERTGPYIAKWTRKVQEMTWPEMGIEFAKRAIEDTPPIVDFNETASKVQKAFEDHSSPRLVFLVVFFVV